MARYKPSALFEQFRGKIGNSVFTGNRAGNNLRNYVVPSNPQTANQVAIRNIFSVVASLWFGLSSAARAAWTAFANAGYIPLQRSADTLGYTGRQAFSALRTCALFVNEFIDTWDLKNSCSFNFAGDDLSACVFSDLAPDDNPPSLWAPSTTFTTEGGNAVLQDFTLAQAVLQNDALTITLNMDFDKLTNSAGAQTLSVGGQAVGFGIYISNALKAEGQSVVSPFTKKFLSSPIFESGTSAGQGVSNRMALTWSFEPYAFTALEGWYFVTLVVIDSQGQQYPLMSKYINCIVS